MNIPRQTTVLVVVLAASASAGTIENFELVTASNLSPGGTFNSCSPVAQSTCGTFEGTFSVDVSNLPTSYQQPVALPAVDITTTSYKSLGTGSTPGTTYTSGGISLAGTLSGYATLDV